LNSNGSRKEKRARRVVTRPKPTIYGNCDSWSFIVGKKPGAYSRTGTIRAPLQSSNKVFIHSLSTKYGGKHWDKLWAICGPAVHSPFCFRIVVQRVPDMPWIADEVPGFYPKSQLDPVRS
jgi:hypothetical protein